MLRWLLIALLFALPVRAEEVVLGLSQDEVAITTSFDGSEILIFGAVKRETPIPEGELGVIVTIAGPPEPITVRRKERRFGIWVNTDAVEIDGAPSFYAVATSSPLDDVLGVRDNLEHKVSVPSMLRGVETPNTVLDASAYVTALIRINTDAGAYQLLEDTVVVDEDTLFRTRIRLPAALTEGAYETRIFLTRDGQVVASYETAIDVRKVGLERWLFTLSRENPFWYGIMSLAIAIAAGWTASAAFSLLRN
ncbi:TIGR02186 family protein [Tateyamaria omphalii]|uniref:TIGR02186 family protein n=1 Tax=Tateyamaria omphalii TaxID=299262 RepID=UPI001C9932E2|nr:TIGR02186 family protein [Tateyamaria omphalii]MBY5933879.1 TIGR02186 family protein [Tateyamaria omphalii]